ncbi:hypothetical protein [Candidatus Pantoea soli]|uniref:hypothetical protein n=1 Tax=Candidatus Pantoea soli TaxID=3098669 RepID=UPI0016484D83|nr:hypothetical protein [Pantoea soli]
MRSALPPPALRHAAARFAGGPRARPIILFRPGDPGMLQLRKVCVSASARQPM